MPMKTTSDTSEYRTEYIESTDATDGDGIIKKIVTKKIIISADEQDDESESTQVTETEDGQVRIIKKVITTRIVTSDGQEDEDESIEISESIDSDTDTVRKLITEKITTSTDDQVGERKDITRKIIISSDDTEHGDERIEVKEGDIKTIRTVITTQTVSSADDQSDISESLDEGKKILETDKTSSIVSTEEKVHSISEDSSEIKKTMTEKKTTKTILEDSDAKEVICLEKDKIIDETTEKTEPPDTAESQVITTTTSQSQITEDTETIEKSEIKKDTSVKSVTTTIIKEQDDTDKTQTKESSDEIDSHHISSDDISSTGVHMKTITKISTSESIESKDFKEEVISTEEKSVKTVTTTSISEPISEDKITTDSDSTEGSPTSSKSKKKRIKKKIIVYQAGPEGSTEELLTEDKIREAIIEAGGKPSSKTITRIVSSGTTDDLTSFADQENVIEMKSYTESSTTSEKHEITSTEKSTKHETAYEKIENIELDPFSLITKPLEETFKKKTSEYTEEKTSETKHIESKTTTEISKEESSETVEEKELDSSPKTSTDTKVATDAKKLVMKSESQSSASQRTESEADSSTSSAQRTSEGHRDDPDTSSQSEQPKGSKPFSLDEWDKPMGLPSPPEPLEIENNITSHTKQSTTTSTKQGGNYSETNREKSTSEKDESPTKSDADEKSDKEYESSEKDYRQSDNKEAEKSTEPVYIDLTYVPHFGDPHYCNADFFRRIRSRYYVFSGSKPSKEVFNALLEAKQEWKDKDAKVTIIPTYETDTLGYWMAVNQEALSANNIDVAPSASRCTINLQDHETSCSAYRLEL